MYYTYISVRKGYTWFIGENFRQISIVRQNFYLEMGINPMKWKTRSLLYTSLTLIIFYILFVYKKKHYVQVEGIIKNADPVHVWEFITDFSNIKKLNPTMYVK